MPIKEITLKAHPEYYKEFIWDIFSAIEEKSGIGVLDKLNPDELLEAFIEKMYEKGWKITKEKNIKKEIKCQ